MKKSITVVFVLLVAICVATILSSCATLATPDSEEVKDFKRATLTIANQVSDLLEYDYKYYAMRRSSESADIAFFVDHHNEVSSLTHALDTGLTLCGGYSKLFYKLAEEAGYDVYYITTTDHAYNVILFEGTWYDDRNRNARWLYSSEVWNDWYHASIIRVYKLDDNYEDGRNATLIGTGAKFFGLSEGEFKVSINKGRTVTITGYTGTAATVVIPAAIGGKPVVGIGREAFSGCTSLTSIQVDVNNIYYKSRDGVLFNKRGTSLIKYPAGKQEGQYAIPAGVTGIGESAFSGCTGLTSISIPASVTTIGDHAFSGCTSLTSILVDTKNKEYTSRDGVLFNKKADTLIRYPTGKQEGQYAIPTGVTGIGEWAFSGCTGLTSVSIPQGVTTIGDSAFYECTGLTSISISSGVTSIGDFAFNDCDNLNSISIPANVKIGALSPFEKGFDDYYNTNGKKAGVYTFRNRSWSYSAQ